MRWGKNLKYSDLGSTKKQRIIIKETIAREVEEEVGKQENIEKDTEDWKQIQETLGDLFSNIENYDGYENFGQKKIDTSLFEEHIYNRK